MEYSADAIALIIFFIIVSRFIWGYLVGYLAKQKNQKYGAYFGFFLGLFGFVFVIFLPDKSYKEVHVIIENK